MIRVFKNFIKNIHRINVLNILLFKKNNKLIKRKYIDYKDIFIITSCINIYDGNYYIHNLRHSPNKRFTQTIDGLKSIKKYYPYSYIVIIESSKLSLQYVKEIETYVDEYIDYSNDRYIKVARKHFNKGVPQFYAYIKYFEENGAFLNAKTIHFLGGRYSLYGNFANFYNNTGIYFLYNKINQNVSTRYFFVKSINLGALTEPFKKTMFMAVLGNSVEDFIHRFNNNIFLISKIGVSGMINGLEFIEE